ncbi:MAG: tyrosine-type recombinase/integrase [Brevinema sp.]
MSRPPRTNIRTKISDKDLERIKYDLYEKHDIDFAYFIETLSITASRVGEILYLSYKNIDYDNGQLNIFQSKVKETKPISVPKSLLDKLIHLMKLNESKDGYIFYGAMRQKHFYTRKFKELKDELNLNPLYEMRMIRHTSISFVAKNFGVAVAQQLAGHKNSRTTLDHYYIADAENVENATSELAKKWGR